MNAQVLKFERRNFIWCTNSFSIIIKNVIVNAVFTVRFKININKENNVFKDALGVKGLGFKHHGNHPCNHGSHYGNHHGNYHAEQLLFSCQCSKVSSCRVVRLSSCQVRFLGTRDMLNKFFLCPCSNLTVYRRKWQWFFYTLSCEFRVHRAGSQVIIGIVQVSVFV